MGYSYRRQIIFQHGTALRRVIFLRRINSECRKTTNPTNTNMSIKITNWDREKSYTANLRIKFSITQLREILINVKSTFIGGLKENKCVNPKWFIIQKDLFLCDYCVCCWFFLQLKFLKLVGKSFYGLLMDMPVGANNGVDDKSTRGDRVTSIDFTNLKMFFSSIINLDATDFERAANTKRNILLIYTN